MGFRYGKSLRIGKGFRLNISKSGVGMSVGVKGARIGVGPRGLIRTYSIPGTSVSYTKQTSLKSRKNSHSYADTDDYRENKVSNESESFYFGKQKTNEKKWLVLGIISMFFAIVNYVFVIFLLLFGYLYYHELKNHKNKSGKLYNKALDFYQNKNFSKAIPLLKKSVECFDENKSSLFLLAVIYHEQKQFDKAIKHIDYYIALDSLDKMAKLIKADCLFEAKKIDKAIELLQSFSFDNKELEIKRTILLGKCFFYLEKYNMAIEQFTKVPISKGNTDGDILECNYLLGVSYYMIEDKEKAKIYLSNI